MKVVFKPFDTQHYLMNLRLNMSGALQCDRVGDQYCLILRLPYEQNIAAITPEVFMAVLQNAADELLTRSNAFVRVGEADLGLFLHGAMVTGFQVMGETSAAASYVLFCCEVTLSSETGEKTLVVYCSPNGLFASSNVCNVPAVVQVRLQKEIVRKFHKEKFTGYYTADFSGCAELSRGSIWYNVPGSQVNYPVNNAMLHQKRIYIKSEFPPVFHGSGGVRVDLI